MVVRRWTGDERGGIAIMTAVFGAVKPVALTAPAAG